jgi:predicted transposase YbfD/YdcC
MTLLTPKSLKLLNLQGCLATIDAMECQKMIAADILHKGADYLLSVQGNGNQPKLIKAFEQTFLVSELVHFEGDAYVTDEKKSRPPRNAVSHCKRVYRRISEA